jgi:hypothetical protein
MIGAVIFFYIRRRKGYLPSSQPPPNETDETENKAFLAEGRRNAEKEQSRHTLFSRSVTVMGDRRRPLPRGPLAERVRPVRPSMDSDLSGLATRDHLLSSNHSRNTSQASVPYYDPSLPSSIYATPAVNSQDPSLEHAAEIPAISIERASLGGEESQSNIIPTPQTRDVPNMAPLTRRQNSWSR